MCEIIRSVLCSSGPTKKVGLLKKEGRGHWWVKIESRENATCTGVGLIVEEGQGKKSRDPLLPQRLQGGVCLAPVSLNVPQLIGQQLPGLEHPYS